MTQAEGAPEVSVGTDAHYAPAQVTAIGRRPLRNISEVRHFFRTNDVPIYFVGATPFNLLGLDRWIRNFFHRHRRPAALTSEVKLGAVVRDVLDLPCGIAEQMVGKVGQGTRGRDLLPDLRDLLVLGIAAGHAIAHHASAVPDQARLGSSLPVLLVE